MEITTERLDRKTEAMPQDIGARFKLDAPEYVYLRKILQAQKAERLEALAWAARDLQAEEMARAAVAWDPPHRFRKLANLSEKLRMKRREYIAMFQWMFCPLPQRDTVTDAIIKMTAITARLYAPELLEEVRPDAAGTSRTPPVIIDISEWLARPRRK